MTIALRRWPSNILWSRLQGTSSLGSIFTHACLLEPAHGCLDLLLPHSRWAGNLREAEEVGETLAGSQNDENPPEISLVYEIIFDNKVLREQLWTTDWCLFKSYSFLLDISRASSLWFLKGRTYPVMFYGGGSWLWGGLNACKVLYINPVRKNMIQYFHCRSSVECSKLFLLFLHTSVRASLASLAISMWRERERHFYTFQDSVFSKWHVVTQIVTRVFSCVFMFSFPCKFCSQDYSSNWLSWRMSRVWA